MFDWERSPLVDLKIKLNIELMDNTPKGIKKHNMGYYKIIHKIISKVQNGTFCEKNEIQIDYF